MLDFLSAGLQPLAVDYADLAVTAQGKQAEQWLGIIQAYAGPPGAGREPGRFAADAA